MGRIAVPVGVAFPRADRRQMRRLQAGDAPLVHRIVGNAGETDLAVAPGLPGRPFDALVEVLRLPHRMVIDDAGRAPRPARSEEHTSELQSLMRISYAVFCLKKK